MQLSYLAQGEKTKETISGKNLPEGIALDSVEKYDAKGGQLYFITFSGTVKNLAHFSDSLISPPSGAATPPAESRPDSASSPTRSRPRT